MTLSRPHGAILSDLQSLAQSTQGHLNTPQYHQKQVELLQLFHLNEFFSVGLAMFEQFSLLPWSPQGLPGTAEQILVAYIAEIYIFALHRIWIYIDPSY